MTSVAALSLVIVAVAGLCHLRDTAVRAEGSTEADSDEAGSTRPTVSEIY